MGQEVKTAQDFLDILKRRKSSIIVTAAAVFVISAVFAFLLPPHYRSSSTILIEDQEVPREFVNTTVTSYADQRLQTINQRIMGTDRLLEIIKKFNLYPELKVKWTTEEIVAKMRKDIKLSTISADVIDPRSGSPRQATIAFTLSYQGKSPQVVQQVAGELASLYLSENLATRERQSQGTTSFMEEEMKQVKAHLAETDAKISAYKQRNLNALPELAQANLQIAESTEHDIVSLNEQLRGLREKESYAASQLATISTDAASQDKTRLAELRVRLGELKTRFTDEHPDVIKTRSELAELVKQLRSSGRDTADNKPDNVAYITLSSQLAGNRSEIDSVKRQIGAFTKKRDDYRKRIASTPGVEEGYRVLLDDRIHYQLKADELTKKFLEAKSAHGLEEVQKGERFSLIDAARLPETPVSPNIPAILLIGLLLGIGSGAGVAAIKEQSDHTARTPEQLYLATSLPVLACIPAILTWQDFAERKLRRRNAAIGVIVVLVLIPVAFQFLVMDLDVFWARLLRRVAKL
ncbi:MAG: chain-length determining protein [Geobacteraceae bacterium GWC2_58_44]|nr:MAG: chain-length determining protein [Geobacteraceae bacterium GWC2_58_44]HBG04837.1 chain-length determining protein [Geobacter sp.]